MELSKIENLAISGAGVKIVAQVGAFSVLEEKGLIKQIKSIGGVSAGSIIACMACLGYTASELKQLCFELDFRRFEDGGVGEKLNVLRDYGINKGDTLLKFLQQKIEAKTGSKYTTFAGLYAGGYKDLRVFAACLNDGTLKEFSYNETPQTTIADAVRWSISIPLEFEPHYTIGDKNTYVDGGMILNYPLNKYPQHNTIGICFNPSEQSKRVDLDKGQFPLYVKLMIQAFMAAQDVALSLNEDNLNRSIILNSCNVSATDFNLKQEQKDIMFAHGVEMANNFLQKVPL
jgi:NTE family protein